MRGFAFVIAVALWACNVHVSIADINDAVNCGFTDNTDRAHRRDWLDRPGRAPAAIFRMSGTYYVIAPGSVFGRHHRFYFKDGDETFYFDPTVLLSNDTIFPPPHGPDFHIWEIPMADLESDLQKIIVRCAISEEQFITPKLGMRVTVRSQSFGHSTTEPHSGIVAALADKSYNWEPFSPKPYHIVLPASPGAPSTSWVTVDGPVQGIDQPVAGLMIDHSLYKKGDCFIDIDVLRWLINPSFEPNEILAELSSPVKPSTSVFIRNLRFPSQFNDNWRPTGMVAGSVEKIQWEIGKSKLRLKNYQAHFGVPGCLVKNGEALYLVVDSTSAVQLQADSIVCMAAKGVSSEIRIGNNFKVDDSTRIDIDGVFVAYACDSNAPAQQALDSKSLALASSSNDQEIDFLFGRSIPSALLRTERPLSKAALRNRIEEAIVYTSIQNHDDSNLSLSNLLDFDGGIYPAALSAVSGHRERFFGLLGFNAKTQEPTIYTAEELMSFLPAR